MTSPTPLPGVYPDVSREAYDQWEAVNQSRIKNQPSAMHLRHALEANDDERTEALNLGEAEHLALLEPSRFLTRVAIGPVDLKNTAEWKGWVKEQPEGTILLRKSDGERIAAMGLAVRSHPTARKLLEAGGMSEASMLWRDAVSGIMCKARVDRIPAKLATIIDLKTTRDASPEAFAKSVCSYGYDVQAAFYVDGYGEATGDTTRGFTIVAVENEPPHAVAVYSMDDWLDIGRHKYLKALAQIAECRKSGVWPGYSDRVEPLQVPNWYLRINGIDQFTEGDVNAFAGR